MFYFTFEVVLTLLERLKLGLKTETLAKYNVEAS